MTLPIPPAHQTQPARLDPLLSEADLVVRQRRFRRARRLTGLLVGLGMGAAYSAIALNVNSFYLPGLPLYQAPPGLLWSVILSSLGGALIGWVCLWAESSWVGILWGSLLAALVFDGYALLRSLSEAIPLSILAVSLGLIILPMTAMAAAVVGSLRWAIERQQAAWQDHRSSLIILGIPLLLSLTAAGLGWTNQYNENARTVLLRMQDLLQAGQRTAQTKALPPALTVEKVENFLVNGLSPYTLEWAMDPNNRYAIARSGGANGLESIAIARFENGWMLICLYPTPLGDPECVSRWQPGSAVSSPQTLEQPVPPRKVW